MKNKFGISKNVFVLGLVSFFNDVASEMIYPIVPIFLTGVLGAPVSFLDKYNPDKFEIIGMAEDNGKGFSGGVWDGKNPHCVINGQNKFKRIFIRHKKK